MATTNAPRSPEYRPPHRDGATLEEPTENARQGVTGHNVRFVLAISIGVLVVLFAIVYLVFFAG